MVSRTQFGSWRWFLVSELESVPCRQRPNVHDHNGGFLVDGKVTDQQTLRRNTPNTLASNVRR